MSEAPLNHPTEEKLDSTVGEVLLPAHAENNPVMARQEAAVLHQSTAEKEQLLAKAEAAVESTASNQVNPLERLKAEERAERQTPAPSTINRELKKITLQRELKQVRRKLPARQRPLSRLIHLPAISVISETAAKSVSRPSGLLGGGLVAFIGSSAYLYLAKHDRATYNYLVFLMLFVGGFIVGLALEFAIYLATTSVRHRNDN